MSRTAIALALCLLVAGCTAPTAPSGPTPTAVETDDSTADGSTAGGNATTGATATTADSAEANRSAVEDAVEIPVSGGSLPVEHERVFERTTDLLGVSIEPPTVVVIKSPAEIREDTGGPATPGDGSSSRSFGGVMGIGSDGSGEGDSEDGDEGVSVAAYAPSAHSVVVNERVANSDRERVLERTIAHEFVHNVQFRQEAFDRTQDALDLPRSYSRDRYLTYASVIEGAAVFVGDAYDDRYLAGNSATITSAERYRSSPSGVKYSIARYYFGNRYLQHRYDSARNLSSVYDDPPRTTEQLLHNDTDGSEVPKTLYLSVSPGENRTRGRTNVNGELFTRIALGSELNTSLAADAAAGWGADRLVPVEPENESRNRSFVWATRWDSPAEADEFESALGTYLDSRAERSDGVWRDGPLTFRTVRLSDGTVVLLAGDEPFVRSASVSGTSASVSVEANGSADGSSDDDGTSPGGSGDTGGTGGAALADASDG